MKPNNRGKFIVFEGLDGTGKSTCAKLVAGALTAVHMTTPSGILRARRPEILAELGAGQETHHLFYLSVVMGASDKVRAHLEAGRTVVLDRYFISTQAYAAFRGSRLGLEVIDALLQPADLTVLLEAPLAIRRARVLGRGFSTDADQETLDPQADERLQAEHQARIGFRCVGELLKIDTSQIFPEALVEKVIAALARLSLGKHLRL